MVGELLLQLLVHLLLTGLPAAAAALLLASRGEERVPVLLAAALAASGIGGLLGFWVIYGSHVLGQTFSFVVAFGSALAVAWVLFEGKVDRRLLRRLSIPFALWALGSVFIVFLGFMHGGTGEAMGTASNRFQAGLPSDIDIPLYYAEFFYSHGHHGAPPEFPGEWLSSDRPPLQIGYILAQQPLHLGREEVSYVVLGVCLQQLWIIGLWALVLAAGLGRLTRGLVAVVVLVSPLAIDNAFYVWPKLLPAAMLLGAAALLITPLWGQMRSRLWAGGLVGVLFGLAMMGHGSSFFPLVALVLVPAFRGFPGWRWVAVGAAAFAVVTVPWAAYQKYADPPGNRLVKWQIGGVPQIDPRGSLQTIRESYGEAGVGGTIRYKADNALLLTGGRETPGLTKQIVEDVGKGKIADALGALRTLQFFFLLPALGLLLLGPLAMLVAALRRRRRGDPADWRFARDCLLVFVIGIVSWCLLMFGNSDAKTLLHQGSYLVPILGMCLGVAGLRAVVPRLGAWIVGIWAALMLAAAVPAIHPPEGTSYSPVAILIAAACLVGFCWVALRRERQDEAPAPAPVRPVLAIDSPA